MLARMDDAARQTERDARLQARNERRRKKGKPAWEPVRLDDWRKASTDSAVLAPSQPASGGRSHGGQIIGRHKAHPLSQLR